MTAGDEDRLRSVHEGLLRTGPETLQINLTNTCNLDCIFCWNHSPLAPSRSPAWHAQRLSKTHLDGIIRSLPRLRPGRVQLSGRGEPLLHPEVQSLLSALQQLSIRVNVQTNGVGGLSVEELAQLGVSRLLVNISAGTAAGYRRTHPSASGATFERVVERLRLMRELEDAPSVSLIAVIQRENAEEIPSLLDLSHQLGADQLQLKGMELSDGLEELELVGEQRVLVRRDLKLARERAADLGVRLDAAHLHQLLSARGGKGRSLAARWSGATEDTAREADRAFTPSLSRGPCYMGWYYLRVTCDGRVMFCCKDKLVDHLDRRDLYAIWRAPAYQLLRLAGRDGDGGAGLFDDKCRACSNFSRNREIGRLLERSADQR